MHKSILVFLAFTFLGSNAMEYLVHPDHRSTDKTCLTLEDYIRKTDLYFTSNTKFLLLKGEHFLLTSLVIDSITNLTFMGINTTEAILLSSVDGIILINSSEILIETLSVVHDNYNISESNSFLQIRNSSLIHLLEVQIKKNRLGNTLSRAGNILNSTVTITNCTFSGGYSHKGGALKIHISNVTFCGNISFKNNTAISGGGSIFTSNSKLVFTGNTLFESNKILTKYYLVNGGAGGAIYAVQSVVEFKCPFSKINYCNESARNMSKSNIICSTLFLMNSGPDGGAIYSNKSVFLFQRKTDIIGNTGIFRGGAIFAVYSNFSFDGEVLLTNNSIQYEGGGLYCSRSKIKSVFNLIFQYNSANHTGGAVYLLESEFIVSGTVNFLANEAYRGGGMALESAQLALKPPVNMTFRSNKATYGGGIIYIEWLLYIKRCYGWIYGKTNCFFYIVTKNVPPIYIHLNFIRNVAISAGSDIFGGNLDNCNYMIANTLSEMNGLNFLKKVSTFSHTQHDNSSISSHPLHMCFCEAELPRCTHDNNKITLSIPHGRTFVLSVVAVGQNHAPVPSEILHSFVSNSSAELRWLTSNYDETSRSCNNISLQLFSTQQREVFSIYPAQCKTYSTKVTVNFEACPPGFEFAIYTCICEKRLKRVIDNNESCTIETGLIKHPGKMWIKPLLNRNYSYEGFMWIQNCPKIFCKIQNSSYPIWLNFSSSDVDSQCAYNRTGIMCRSCKEYHSLTLNNLNCHACSNSSIGLTLVFLAAGIAIIGVLLALHMTVASGTINGLILYANVLNISKDLFFPPEQTNSNPLTIFIAWLNLDFGISTCYFNGLDYYSYTWLQFAFPFYLWALIGLIVIASKFSSSLARLLGSNPVAVLATVILMSYTKLLHTSHDALAFSILKYSNDTEKKVWKMDPNISYFDGKHIPLVLFSVGVISFLIIPYILILLLGYHLQAINNKKGFKWVNKFKPLLDPYYAPYQKGTRYWTGLLLVIRAGLYVIYILTEENEFNPILIVESSIFTAISLIPWLRIRVYEKVYIDILEASFILNICILAIGTYHTKMTEANQLILSLFSAGIAFVEFLGIVLFHIFLRIRNKPHFKVWKIMCVNFLKKFYKNSVQQGLPVEEIKPPDNTNFTTTAIDIREPLLDECATKL